MSQLLAKLDGLDAKRTKGPWTLETKDGDYELEAACGDTIISCTLYDHTAPYLRDAAFITALENAWPTIRSALAALAPSCPVGEKELENCADLSGTNQQEPRSSTASPWRAMETAKKDGTPVLLLIKNPVPREGREDLRQWDGLQFVGKHPGIADSGFDVGWNFAAPVGCGGFPDDWFVGWRPMPVTTPIEEITPVADRLGSPSDTEQGAEPGVMPKVHDLKIWPEYYKAVANGTKTHELRRNDRNFRTGDVLVLHEWEPCTEEYTGHAIVVDVPYLFQGGWGGLQAGFVCMSIKRRYATFIGARVIGTPDPAPSPGSLKPLPTESWRSDMENAPRDGTYSSLELEIHQHHGWLKGFAGCINEDNWRDMQDRINWQLNRLSEAFDKYCAGVGRDG